MLSKEIDFLNKNLIYLEKTYDISLSHEDFIHDIDLISLVTDKALLNAKYQSVYKKYLKLISNELYKKNISYSNIKGVENSFKSKTIVALMAYEIVMVGIIKSSIFEHINDIPVAEILFAGMKKDKYISEITPNDLPSNMLDEYKLINKNINKNEMMDELKIMMHEYKDVSNKELKLNRIALVYKYLNEELNKKRIFKDHTIKNTLYEFTNFMVKEYNFDSSNLKHQLIDLATKEGNYTKSIKIIIEFLNNNLFFKDIRNIFENEEQDLNKHLEAFNLKIDNLIPLTNKIEGINDDKYLENELSGKEN